MKSILKHIYLIGIAIFSLHATITAAALLPAGTKLGITQGSGSAPNLSCATGSCFALEIAPGFVGWTNFGPGTDGGIIIGKPQKCGTQELGPSGFDTTPSDLTAAWSYFGNYGTFCTDPGGERNIFDDAGCSGSVCRGKTELKYLYAVWNGYKFPVGSSEGCVLPACTSEQISGNFVTNFQINPVTPVTGGDWSIDFGQVVPSGPFQGARIRMLTRGTVTGGGPCYDCVPPGALLVANQFVILNWVPAISGLSGGPFTCRIGTTGGAVVTVASDCSRGTFYATSVSANHITSFTYILNDGQSDWPPVTISVYVRFATPTFTATATATGTPTPIPSPLCTPNPPPPPLSLSTTAGQPVSWDAGQYASNCSIAQPAANGIVTLTGNCTGTYTPNIGFIGTDQFTYAGTATAGSCPANFTSTVTIDVCPAGGCATPTPTPRPCEADYPVTRLSSIGKQGTLSVTLTGNIISSTNKAVKVCPGTTLSYVASSTKDVVKCRIKNNLTPSTGTLQDSDHLKCTDKPLGKDKIQFKVKSGVK